MCSQATGHRSPLGDSAIIDEAADWFERLQNDAPDPDDPYCDPIVRNRAFFAWLQSPRHLRIFMEIVEIAYRMRLFAKAIPAVGSTDHGA
jgi:hypothetical protein